MIRQLIIFNMMALFIGCDQDNSNKPENPLLGKWLDVNTCDSCLLFDFREKNELILHQIPELSYDTLSYDWLGNDLVEIDYYEKKEYTVEFYTNDSLEIVGFALSIIPENNSTVLKRIR